MKLLSWIGSLFSSQDTQKKDLYTLSSKALDLIIQYETGGRSYYEKFLKHPTWPQGASGVTIGVGYDLGYNTLDAVRLDWAQYLSDHDLKRILAVVGVKGEDAKLKASSVQDITIPWEVAVEVFEKTTIPKFIQHTLKAFPESENLKPDAFGALVSLVFNRGPSMRGSRRAEMRRIRALVPSKDYKGIADQIRRMKSLWSNKGLNGLLKRREAEAKLVETCI